MNLSRSTRAQLGTLALVLSVVEQVRARLDDHAAQRPDVRRILARLALDRDYCWQDVVERSGIPYRIDADGVRTLLLDQRRHGQWLRFMHDFRARTLRSVPDGALAETGGIDARAWLNAVLIRVQEQADHIPWRDKRRVILWNAVLGSLQALYECYDPELDNTDAMRQGAQWAEGLRV